MVKAVDFDEPSGDAMPVHAGIGQRSLLSVNGALILVLGILPGGLMALCIKTMGTSLGL